MAEFLELIESIQGEAASVQALFSGGSGEHRIRSGNNPKYNQQLLEAVNLLADVKMGRKPAYLLEAAMTTSDFPLLFGDIFDRQMLAVYREWPTVWDRVAKKTTVRDFRTAQLLPPLIGGKNRLDQVDEQEEYPDSAVSEQARIEYAVKKYGRRFGISWETLIGDLMGQFDDLPSRLAVAARRTEDRFVVEMFVDANGPHASLYTSGNKNIVNIANGAASNNPALSIQGLQDAMKVLARQVDEDGEPIFIDTVTLVVPPALEIVAMNLLNALQLELTAQPGVRDGGTGEQRLITANWMRNRMQLVVMPYIPLTAVTANTHTSWFLFANPNVGREALRFVLLQGHEEPEIWIKEPNARRIGGGAVNPTDGDFDTDSIHYRVRHVLGGTRVDGKATVASNGSGA